jgi:hypothetical protein
VCVREREIERVKKCEEAYTKVCVQGRLTGSVRVGAKVCVKMCVRAYECLCA